MRSPECHRGRNSPNLVSDLEKKVKKISPGEKLGENLLFKLKYLLQLLKKGNVQMRGVD